MSKAPQRVFLAAFVILDLVLIVAAVRHVNETPPASDSPRAAAAPSSGPPTISTPSPTSPTQVAYDFSAADAVSLSAANDGTVVYGTRGRCADSEAAVMVSTNAGADFAVSQTGLTTTLAVKTTGAESITVVGTTSDCDTRQVTSTDGGLTWTADGDVKLWHRDPTDPSIVVSPARQSQPAADCVVTSISEVTSDSARVSCVNGAFYGSGDKGSTWVPLGRLDNVRVSSFLTPSAGYALARFSGCAANAFTTDDGGVTWTSGGCISGEPAQAIASTSSALTAVVAGEPYVSDDDGQAWTQP